MTAPTPPARMAEVRAIVVDGRSVDELIRDASLTARGMLWDPTGDVAAKIRSWGPLVEASSALWSAIPSATTTRDEQLDHLTEVTALIHRATERREWPGPGRGNPDLSSITADLARAATLVSSRRVRGTPLSAAGERAAEASRVRILHTLHVTSHVLAVAIQHHQRDLAGVHPRLQRTTSHQSQVRVATDLGNHFASIEANLEALVDLRWPAGLAAQPAPGPATSRLEDALTAWDHQAHRTLSSRPSIAALLVLTDSQRYLAFTTTIVSAAASRTHQLDSGLQQRLHPQLMKLENAWGHLCGDLDRLASRTERPPADLIRAAADLRTAQRELTHDKASLASPELMAARANLPAAASSLHRSLTTGANLAYLAADIIESGQLRTPARTAHLHAMELRERDPGNALRHFVGKKLAGPDIAAVNPADLNRNRAIPLPLDVRADLQRSATAVIKQAIVTNAASSAERAPAARAHQHSPRERPTRQRTLPAGSPALPVSGPSR